MRYLNRLIWAAVVAGAVSTPALAQQGQVISSGGRPTSASYTGTGGMAGGIGSGGGLGGGGGQGGGSLSGSQLSGTSLASMEAAPNITAPGSTGRSGSSAINSSNWLGPTFGNPMYQGIPSNAKSNAGPGGFGASLYGNTGGAGGGSIGYAGGTTGATGRAGGLGGRGGIGGLGGVGGAGGVDGSVIQLPVQISYPAVARFPTAPLVAAPQLQTDLSGLIARSNMIANPAGVQVVVEKNNVVTIRGTVRDEDEARILIGAVRLTPGVRDVKSELTLPKQ